MRPVLVEGGNIWGVRKISGLSLVRASQPDLSDAAVVATLPGGYSNNWAWIIRIAAGKLAAYVTSLDPDQAGFYLINDSNPASVTYARKAAGFPAGYPYNSLQNMATDGAGNIWACTYGTKSSTNPPYYIYRSTDYGETWAECYHHIVAENTHMHAIAWDSYRNRVWCCIGDAGAGGRTGIAYSDDLGATWTFHEAGVGINDYMLTDITPLADRVLFGTDRAPAGVLAWFPPGGANVVADANIAQVQFAQADDGSLNLGFTGRPVVSGGKLIIPFAHTASYAKAWLCGGDGFGGWKTFNLLDNPAANPQWIRYFVGVTSDGWLIGVGPLTTPEYIFRMQIPAWL